jgi:capsular polysaccharide biosynthesis protein
MIDTYKEVIFRKDFLNVVCQEINNNDLYPEEIKPERLAAICTLNKCNETDVFDVIVTSTDPALSYVACKTMAEVIDEKLPERLPYPSGVVTLNIVQNASQADAMIKNDKNLMRNTVIGFMVGVVLSMVAIYLYSVLDIVVRDKKKLEDNLDLPVLGVIPRYEAERNTAKEEVEE